MTRSLAARAAAMRWVRATGRAAAACRGTPSCVRMRTTTTAASRRTRKERAAGPFTCSRADQDRSERTQPQRIAQRPPTRLDSALTPLCVSIHVDSFAVQLSSTGLELSSLRASNSGGGSKGRKLPPIDGADPSLSGSLISSEHPSAAGSGGAEHEIGASAAVAAPIAGRSGSISSGGNSRSHSPGFGLLEQSRASLEQMSVRLRNMLMEDSSETAEEEVEMMDYDNPEDHILERKLDEDHASSAISTQPSSSMGPPGNRPPGSSRIKAWCQSFARNIASRNWRKYKLTALRMCITIMIGVAIGLTGFFVSKSVNAMIHNNMHIINDMMNKDRPAAAFFTILIISCIYTGVAALFVTFGSWQTRGSGVGRLNAYLSGMSSSRFLALKTLFVKIGGLILTVSAGIKQGMEGPFIHIGAMIGLHVSRLLIWIANLVGGRCGMTKYTSIVSGVVDERMFISSGAAAGFSVAFNAPIAGVLYVQDGAFAYWQGEYTIRTFLCTMTAVTTINMCFKQGEELPSRGLIDIDFARTTIVLREFWGFFVLGIVGGLLGILFTKINVAMEKFRHKYLQKLRLPNVLDVLACTVLTVLLSFILPFMLGCHDRWTEDSCDNADRCIQFHCGPEKYSDLATFFFTLPEEAIRILFDRKTSIEAHIPYQTLLVFAVFYFLMCVLSYGMAVPGGLFVPCIIIGAAYGRLVGLAVQSIFTANTPAGETPPLIIPGVYALLGSASLLGGITRMALPISVMMIEITSDSQFLIPIMLVVLLAKVVADFGTPALYAQHLALDGVVMVFGDKPPGNLKKLTAADIMSRHSIKKLDVIESVAEAWKMVKDTKHNAFPVVDSELGTLRSIIQKRRQANSPSQHAMHAEGGVVRKRTTIVPIGNAGGKRGDEESKSSAFMESSGSSSGPASPFATSASIKGTGVFLGLIQRRHLIYVLTSMPCFPSSTAARDSEPMTALPYELQLAQYNLAQQARKASNGGGRKGSSASSSGSSASPDAVAVGSSGSDGLEVVPLSSNHPSSSPLTVQPGSPASSPSNALLSPPPPLQSVSHALMHASGPSGGLPLLNHDGASASASFVEWCARQANNVGDDLTKVAAGDLSAGTTNPATGMPLPSAATPHLNSLTMLRANSLGIDQSSGVEIDVTSAPSPSSLPSRPAQPSHTRSLPSSQFQSSGGGGFTSGSHSAPGSDLSVQSSMLHHFVNLSPFIDQGAYTVSESVSARRVWALFRSLGMRHIVVLNHQHQPVGVITKKDLVSWLGANPPTRSNNNMDS